MSKMEAPNSPTEMDKAFLEWRDGQSKDEWAKFDLAAAKLGFVAAFSSSLMERRVAQGDAHRCFICNEPFQAGQMVLPDVNEGLGHRECFGEDREGYVKDTNTGEPLGPDDPIPAGEPYDPADYADPAPAFDMLAHLARQREWSGRTFGPGPRTAGVIDHIRKELREIEADPSDITEWIDVVILALDGAWRAGYQPQQIIDAMVGKQIRNEDRVWPDWRTMPSDKAIEHDRSGEPGSTPAPLEEAARNLIAAKFETYKARNGRDVGIQDERGEKCWIVPFGEMFALETSLASTAEGRLDAISAEAGGAL